MTTIVGGLRTRLVHDSFKNMIEDSLELLGWMDSGRGHDSVTVQNEPLKAEEDAVPNLIALDLWNSDTEEAEMGSSVLTFDTYHYIIEIFAESTAVGSHLKGDIRDILLGKFSTIGRTGPTLDVMNLQLATPVSIATVAITDVQVERIEGNKPHQAYWWAIMVNIEDEYGDEAD